MTLPVVAPPDEDAGEVGTGGASVAAVLLAAGTSSRYGDANKLLVDVDCGAGTAPDGSSGSHSRDSAPMVRRSARALLEAGLDPVIVVVGHEQERVRNALAGLDITFVENPEYERGQASSVRAGVSALQDAGVDAGGQTTSSEPSVVDAPEDADEQSSSSPGSQARQDAAVFALGDMPYVDPESVRALVAAYEAGLGTALAAGFEGERGNPVLFDERHFDALGGRAADQGEAAEGANGEERPVSRAADQGEAAEQRAASGESRDVGGKRVLLSADDAAVVETGDPGVRRDVDEPGDFA